MTEHERIRRRLIYLTEEYVESMIDNTPKRLPLAPDVICTYNGYIHKVGDNDVWRHCIRIPSRQAFFDPEQGQAVFYCVATNESTALPGSPDTDDKIMEWFHVVRLKVVGDSITEVEEVACLGRSHGFYKYPSEYELPEWLFEIPVPEEERCSRAEIVQTVEKYWDGLQRDIEYKDVPVHPSCRRRELGDWSTDTKEKIDSFHGMFRNAMFGWKVIKRRYPIVDPIRGFAVSFVHMDVLGDSSAHGKGALIQAFKIDGGFLRQLFSYYPNETEEGETFLFPGDDLSVYSE